MKKHAKSLAAAILCAATVLTTCFTSVYAADEGASGGQPQTTEIVIDDLVGELGNDVETRPLEEGDQWAIDLIDPTETDGELPGGYVYLEYNLENQGKLYMNEGSRIIIRAFNYNEDLQDMETWADNACAMIRIKNITSACDTIFGEPTKTKVCGYDAIVYDCDIIQYYFPEDNTKKEVYDTYKGRNYYFYSDKNAYAIMFDTNDETWDAESANFESFMSSLVVDGNNNDAATNSKADKSSVGIIIAVCAVVVIAVVAAAVVIVKKKKKTE